MIKLDGSIVEVNNEDITKFRKKRFTYDLSQGDYTVESFLDDIEKTVDHVVFKIITHFDTNLGDIKIVSGAFGYDDPKIKLLLKKESREFYLMEKDGMLKPLLWVLKKFWKDVQRKLPPDIRIYYITEYPAITVMAKRKNPRGYRG